MLPYPGCYRFNGSHSLQMGNLARISKLPREQSEKLDGEYWNAINKLRGNKRLQEIEDRIVQEMRLEMQIR